MHHRRRSDPRAGLTLIEVVAVVLVVALLAAVVLPAIGRQREVARRIRCQNNLNQLASAMDIYTEPAHCYPCPLGRTRSPNAYNGAEWLATLYWTAVVKDPSVFLCPSSGDTNDSGVDIGMHMPTPAFGSQTVSYAGMHYNSRFGTATTRLPVLHYRMLPPTVPMASDDTQGDIHHGTLRNGGMNVLFFDSHVEFKTDTELDLKAAVGQEGGLLEQLRN